MRLRGDFSCKVATLKGGRRFPHRRQASVWKPTPTQLHDPGSKGDFRPRMLESPLERGGAQRRGVSSLWQILTVTPTRVSPQFP